MRRVNYLESLCGLLHDIGKPFLRYMRRIGAGLEDPDDEILQVTGGLGDHGSIGVEVVKRATGGAIDLNKCENYEIVIRDADHISAAERGVGDYKRLSEIWGDIEKKVSSTMSSIYGHPYSPFLSPLWITYMTGYINSVGPCSSSPYDANEAIKELHKIMIEIASALERGDVNTITKTLSKLLFSVKDRPLWFPPQPLNQDNILELKPLSYSEAQKRIDYRGVSKLILNGLRRVSSIYVFKPGHFTRGYVDTTSELLKYATLTVPAAVYLAPLPDTSLYSHSKTVAAYSSILSLNVNKFKILVIDARRIQDFVASPVVAKAASRVIRGRSFLVELVSQSLLNYVLELYGGLPYANVLTSEGGTLTVIVPALETNEETAIRGAISRVVESTFRRLKGLWFTTALSREFDLKDAEFIENMKKCRDVSNVFKCGGLFEVLEDLGRTLSIEKTIDETRSRLYIDENDIYGFDAITHEPVTRNELTSGYAFITDKSNERYASLISGDKLDVGDVVSEATHLSLAAGSCLRDMLLLISIYVYKQSSSGLIEPAFDEVKSIVDDIRANVQKLLGVKPLGLELYFGDLRMGGFGFNAAIIPLITLGSVHVLISSVTHPITLSSQLKSAVGLVAGSILEPLLKDFSSLVKNGFFVRIEVRAVNAGGEFLDILLNDKLRDTAAKIVGNDIDLYLGTIHTGTYHPSAPRAREEGYGPPELVDLDAYNIIALVKADADSLGEVKKLLSPSPSRLATLSDLLTMIVAGKTSILASRYSDEYVKRGEPRGPIILYAGGDDVTFYGYWIDSLVFLSKLYREVFNTLYPLSFTSTVSLDRSDYPLLELYSKVVEALDTRSKRDARGWIFILELSSPKPVICNGSIKVTMGMPPIIGGTYDGVNPITPLNIFSSVANILERLDRSTLGERKIEEYKRELMIISRLVSLSEAELKTYIQLMAESSFGSRGVADLNTLYELMRRMIALSYVSARREKSFDELTLLLSDLCCNGKETVKIHHKTGEEIDETFKKALCSKTALDLILLYIISSK